MRHGITHAKYVLMWTEAKAPSLAEMEAMAHEVFERLPRGFRTLCDGVIIRVDDFPTDEVLDEMQAQSEFDLLGLFQASACHTKAMATSPACPTSSGSTAGRSSITGPNMRKRW